MDGITKRIEKIEDEVLMLKRNLASWMTFADDSKSLPMVTYSSSYNGKDTLETVSDLSQLVPEAQQVISSALEDWHGAAVIQCLCELGKTIKQLELELLGTSEAAKAVLDCAPPTAEEIAVAEEPDNEFDS